MDSEKVTDTGESERPQRDPSQATAPSRARRALRRGLAVGGTVFPLNSHPAPPARKRWE